MRLCKFVAFYRNIYNHVCLFTSPRSHSGGVVTHRPLIANILKARVAKARVAAANPRTKVMLRAPSGWLHFTRMGNKSKCASAGTFARVVTSMTVLSSMAVRLMLVAVHAVKITLPTCIRPEAAPVLSEGQASGQSMPSTGPTPSAGHTATSSADILSILEQTFIEGMTKWRSHAIDSSENLASYYNLGAFCQSIRMGLTHATFPIPKRTLSTKCLADYAFSLGYMELYLHFPE